MPNYAEWVSTLALLLGSGSLLWQVMRARREQPIISVDGQWAVAIEGHQNWDAGAWLMPVHVTNAGGRAVTVVDVYWELVGPAGPFTVKSADMGPALPTRLEALSADSWAIRIPIQGTKWAGLTARPAADVVLGKGVVAVHGAPATLGVPELRTGSPQDTAQPPPDSASDQPPSRAQHRGHSASLPDTRWAWQSVKGSTPVAGRGMTLSNLTAVPVVDSSKGSAQVWESTKRPERPPRARATAHRQIASQDKNRGQGAD